MCWDQLPVVFLEDVLFRLSIRQRYYCSLVCRTWYYVFLSARLWRSLDIRVRSFTSKRLIPYRRLYEYQLSHYKMQICLARIGRHIRRLTIHPLVDFYYMGQVLNVLSCFFEFFDVYPMPRLERFEFTFGCEYWDDSGLTVLGTGGKMLAELRRLLANLRHIKELKFNQLLLDGNEAIGLLDDFANNCRDSLTSLEILNCTKHRYPLYHVGMFPRLSRLIITPLQLTDDVLLRVATNAVVLREISIVENAYVIDEVEQISSHIWWEVKQVAPKLKIRLEARGRKEGDVTLQVNAPVHSVVYRTPRSFITPNTVLSLADEYSNTLTTFAQLGLPRCHGSRSFTSRSDSSLVLLIRECRRLNTLVIRERVSTATLLVIASEAPRLRILHVRRNAVLKRCDWPSSGLDGEFYQWLHDTSCCYDAVEREISKLLKCRWTMLTDASFKKIDL